MKYITGLFRYRHVSLQYGYSGRSDALSLCTRKSSCKAWDVLYIRKTCSILDCSIQFRMLWRLLNSPVTSWKKEAYPNVVTGPNFMNFTDKTAIHKFRNRMQKVARISICVLWAISTIISGDIDFWCQIWSKLLKFTGRLFSVVFLGYYYLAQIAQTKELIYHINLQKQNRYQNRTDHPNVEQQLAVSAINKGEFASTQIDHLIALKLQKEKEQSIYLLARPDVGFGCPWASSGGRIPGRLHRREGPAWAWAASLSPSSSSSRLPTTPFPCPPLLSQTWEAVSGGRFRSCR